MRFEAAVFFLAEKLDEIVVLLSRTESFLDLYLLTACCLVLLLVFIIPFCIIKDVANTLEVLSREEAGKKIKGLPL